MELCTYYLLLFGLISMVGVVMVDATDDYEDYLRHSDDDIYYQQLNDAYVETPPPPVENYYYDHDETTSKQKLPKIYIYPTTQPIGDPCVFLIHNYNADGNVDSGNCITISLKYPNGMTISVNGTCYTAVKFEDQVVISMCIYPVKVVIIGHEVATKAAITIWILAADMVEGAWTQLVFKNLRIHFATFDFTGEGNIQKNNYIFVRRYSLIKVCNCEISGVFHFQDIDKLRFVNCKLHFSVYAHFFTGINFLEFNNCTISKVNDIIVTVFIRFCHSVQFISCDIFNNHDYELSLIIADDIIDMRVNLEHYSDNAPQSVTFKNCYFHTVNSDQENFLLVHWSPSVASGSITIDNCIVHGKNCQFTDIVSDSLLSILDRYTPDDQNLTIDEYDITISIKNSIFKNITSNKNILTIKVLVSSIRPRYPIQMSNVSFTNNIGTPIFSSTSIDSQSVSFINNTGSHAGAVFIEISPLSLQQLNVTLTNIQLLDNIHKSDNGGDVYIRAVQDNIVSHIQFFNTSNAAIFFEASTSTLLKWSNTSSFKNIPTKSLQSFPRYIDTDHLFHGSDVFPGKTIFLSGSISVTDYFNNGALCKAIPSLHYDHNKDNCTIQLASNDKIQLKTGKEVMSSVYITATSVDCLEIKEKTITLEMACEHVTTSVALILRGCPLGYKSSKHSDQNGQPLLTCEVADDEGHLIETDDSKQHITCIDRDYWYGRLAYVNYDGSNHPIKVYCGPPYCVQNTEACPLAGYTDTHQKLPWTQDEQCSGLYGGVLCRSCQEHAVFTFGASKCISLNDCKEWQPYLIICLAIVGQIALSLVMICSRAKTTIGVGYLYGPLFFISVYKLLPISNSYLQQTSPLEYTFSVYETVLLLDLDILGKVNWCMFNNINKTLLYSMRFIGPLVTSMVLLVIILIARSNFCFKFKINRIIQSPIQPMCLLIILSFWSLSKTSIEVIKPIIINSEWRFAIQPEYNYLGNGYIIGLFSISVVLLMCFYLPFIFLLFFSQFIRRKINLFRIQPILDAFQSSYKDKYQWFSGVYLFSWLVLNTELPSYVFVIVITGVSVLQFTLHPHKSELLNITDNLLLADIIIMSSLSYMRNGEDRALMAIKYPLLIIPLIYILLGGVWIPLRIPVLKFRSMILNRRQATNNEPMRELMMPIEDAFVDNGDIDVRANSIPQNIIISNEMEREPLIYDDY